jgi:hypothetical protein
MEELLDQLIKKAANETEEAHRHYIAALNGLAGELRGIRRLPFFIYTGYLKKLPEIERKKILVLFFHNTLYSSVI